ncbi:endonuclease domain-containing protein [bacterium]|nr:endonuclease domain-containing protein [bacterium]
MLYYNKKLKSHARQLRKNMTDSETLLWSKIRRKQVRGVQFYRQKSLGNYIVDFYCPKAKLVIEVDGGQHYSEEGLKQDALRDKYLGQLGLHVMRFTNIDVLENIDGVLETIDAYVVRR